MRLIIQALLLVGFLFLSACAQRPVISASAVIFSYKQLSVPFIQQDVPLDSARTHFEIKYLARGERCQELQISKPAAYTTRFDDFQPLQGQQPTLTPPAVEAKVPEDSLGTE